MHNDPSKEALNAVKQILEDENEVDAQLLRSMVNLVGNGSVRTQLERKCKDNNLMGEDKNLIDIMSRFKPSSFTPLECLSNEIANNFDSMLDEYIPIQ